MKAPDVILILNGAMRFEFAMCSVVLLPVSCPSCQEKCNHRRIPSQNPIPRSLTYCIFQRRNLYPKGVGNEWNQISVFPDLKYMYFNLTSDSSETEQTNTMENKHLICFLSCLQRSSIRGLIASWTSLLRFLMSIVCFNRSSNGILVHSSMLSNVHPLNHLCPLFACSRM